MQSFEINVSGFVRKMAFKVKHLVKNEYAKDRKTVTQGQKRMFRKTVL
jgi:hypothetical protein